MSTVIQFAKVAGQLRRASKNISRSRSILIVISYCLMVSSLLTIQPVRSVILPPRFQALSPSPPHLDGRYNFGDDEPYILSVNEGPSISVQIKSNSSITVNLNRPIGEDVNVIVSVNSGPDLIDFVQDHNDNTSRLLSSSLPLSSKQFNLTFKADTFGDRVVKFHANNLAGHAEIICKIHKQPANATIDDLNSFIAIDVYKTWNLDISSQIVGWIYFFAWSASFYFQVILNYKRKSVVGLNFDFLALNLLGFACYSIFNFTFLFSSEIRRQYYKKYDYSRIPVEYNDLFFAVHGFTLTLATAIQCFIYERGQQAVSLPVMIFIGICSSFGLGLWVTSCFNGVTLLNVIFYLSYVKLVITLIKYIPQAFMNYQRKATTGWSIHNILLDFTGGVFSLAQMFILAFNYDDWISIFGNFTKFGLGVISMSFDILFMTQHYILYNKHSPEDLEDSTESIPSPVISQSIRSTSYVPPAPQNATQDGNADIEYNEEGDNGEM